MFPSVWILCFQFPLCIYLFWSVLIVFFSTPRFCVSYAGALGHLLLPTILVFVQSLSFPPTGLSTNQSFGLWSSAPSVSLTHLEYSLWNVILIPMVFRIGRTPQQGVQGPSWPDLFLPLHPLSPFLLLGPLATFWRSPGKAAGLSTSPPPAV